MPNFGAKSKKNYDTLDHRIQEILDEAIKWYDFCILWGHRDEETQEKLYNAGFTQVHYPHSKHNSLPSKAVDIAPFPINWADKIRFYYLGGLIMAIAYIKGYKLRWGADWDMDTDFSDNNFNDIGHFEILD